MSMLVVGDIHGGVHILRDIVKEAAKVSDIKAVIQVGDFGMNSDEQKRMKSKSYGFALPTYFIDGNHEYFDILSRCAVVTEMLPNLFYVPRGTILSLDGRNVAFLGGAASIDKDQRLRMGWHHDERENITEVDTFRLRKSLNELVNVKVDLFVTHVPPLSIVDANFSKYQKLNFGVSLDWTDNNMIIVEDYWNRMGKPQMVCGHMHKEVLFENNSRILAEYQVATV